MIQISLQDLKRKLLKDKLQKLFEDDKKHHEDRKGLHGSEIIKTEDKWCYRKAVLSLNHKANEVKHPDSLIRIFKHGESIHEKWQLMFKNSGIAEFIEARCYSELWELLSTPDAIVSISDKLYIAEIKSMNAMSYRKAVQGAGHPSGKKQCLLYMYLYGIPNGFVLMENKDTQEFDLQLVEFDREAYSVVEEILERLYYTKVYNEEYKQKQKLPERKCAKNTDKLAKDCAYCNICFNNNE